MKYQETKEVAKKYKERYVSGLDALISKRELECELLREEAAGQIFYHPKKYREDLRKMLGWPLIGYESHESLGVEEELLSQEEGFAIYRMQFEILKGLWMTGLFFKVDEGKNPLVIFQHGGAGTPEFAAGIYGSSEYYYDVILKLLKQKSHVFAPQLLLWDDTYSVEYDRKALDARLKRVGSSISAVEIHGIIQILNYFENQEYVSTFGMVGLSYGGFYTLYTAALDERIKGAISCAFFNQRKQYPYSDWTWFDSAKVMDDEEIACLIYPRKLCIELGSRDDLFDIRYGLQAFERLKKMCHEVGDDWLELVIFEGIHEFCPEEEPLIKLVSYLSQCEK